ncbi:ribosomal biogenesis LAS1L [Brachionus plicatilis]|uniref:Ribosomal biogenesis LAS1L n=1 Tax=Brachionus plicatilis TaxID=10195 RepID=A0A3M7QF40_BRAPC|nr:ribosomal biogenesis LAS1L [Brachionus plicatilis]
MEIKQITNWLNWNEWKSVVEDAYNQDNNLDLYKRALYKIIAWESRDNSTPATVICLKELLIAKLYQIDLETTSIEQIYWYQSCLAMNIVRFVNFITELYQNKPKAIPVKTLAAEIGIPDWIVNLRHNATHYNLPSIELLENARDYLYKWLKEQYVDKYTETAIEESKSEKVNAWILTSFKDYINERYKVFTNNFCYIHLKFLKFVLMKPKKIEKQNELINEDIDLAVSQFKNEVIDLLLKNGLMIPTKDQLSSIGIIPEEFIEEEKISMPKIFLNIWMEVLTYLNKKMGSLRLLFDNLIETYHNEVNNLVQSNPLREKFLLSWILGLIKLNSFKNDKFKFSKFEFEYNLKEVLLLILKPKQGNYSLSFLSELTKLSFINELIDAESLDKITHLTYIINQNNPKSIDQVVSNEETNQMESHQNFRIYDIEMFDSNDVSMTDKTNFNISTNTKQSNFKSDWIKTDEIDWSHDNFKLGLSEGQSYESLDLSMGQFLKNEEFNGKDSLNTSSFDEIKEAFKNNQFDIMNAQTIDAVNLEKLKTALISNYWQLC